MIDTNYKDKSGVPETNFYSTHQMAKYSGVCANTVRNYEKYGFISKPERADNGYRIFTDVHILQMTICRLTFSPYINSLIRKAAMEVIYSSAKEDFVLCVELTDRYIEVIKNELNKANEAVNVLANFHKPNNNNIYYDRKESAAIIGTTAETIRNWERNGLIFAVKRDKKSLYNQTEIDFMRLIYLLLSGGFNLQKIYDSLMFLRGAENKQAIEALCDSHDYINLGNIEKNIVEKIEEVLASAHKIKELLEKNI